MVTDPPYGVEYDPGWRAAAGLKKDKQRWGKVANDIGRTGAKPGRCFPARLPTSGTPGVTPAPCRNL